MITVEFSIGFPDEELAQEMYLGNMTAVETLAMMASKADVVRSAFAEYFIEAEEMAVRKGICTAEEAKAVTESAIVRLFGIMQRMSFVAASEVGLVLGRELPDSEALIWELEELPDHYKEKAGLSADIYGKAMDEIERILEEGGNNDN
jgi:hypothetical protein